MTCSTETRNPNRPPTRIRVEVRGIVQGVGFRPFIHGLANKYGLAGVVKNTSYGAMMEVEGVRETVNAFLAAVPAEAPPLARIIDMAVTPLSPTGQTDFLIQHSRAQGSKTALISPDVTVCPDCLREMFDPADRRYRYPFINCTNCGPRYTIIMDVPYDREKTSMSVFEMCPDCQAEYDAPENRRYHAQPNACPVCGPHVSLLNAQGQQIEALDPVIRAGEILKSGEILAVKGLGGFHLAVDAENDVAVARLRERKRREEKPLAVMSPCLDDISAYAHVSEADRIILTSIQRPIVLLEKRQPFPLAQGIAPDNRYIGAMLPYAPLHFLLLDGFKALVMTSGNLSEEPIAKDNDEALRRLAGIADYYLVHNRDIYLRADDSVVRSGENGPRHIRRSRGYVPGPIFLKQGYPPVLAVGGELKNTVCLIKEDRAFISQHIGDLENLSTLQYFELTIDHLKQILDVRPGILAHDLHPDYLSTQWARGQDDMEKIGVQHHHAHVVAAMAEHHLEGPVIGLACDGAGYGDDGRIWGGEILVADEKGYHRAARLDYIPLPGGEAAIREPWRMAVSWLHGAFGPEAENLDLDLYARQDRNKLSLLRQMIEKRLNSPLTSSLGRLFDAAAALAGLRDTVAFEGQAAMMLEMRCPWGEAEPYDFDLGTGGDELIIHPQPMIRQLVQDVRSGLSLSDISGRFHASIVHALAEATLVTASETGLKTVVLSGGCFQNQVLTTGLNRILVPRGLKVYTQDQAPVNDGGISLGQAVSAAARF